MLSQIRSETLKVTGEETASNNSAQFNSKTAKAIEFWLNVTALGVAGDYDFFVETSLGIPGDDDPVWSQQGDTVNVVATGIVNILINRIDHALGERFRVRWVKNTTEVTFDLKAAVLE